MRAPIFRSPIVLATVALGAGLVGKWAFGSGFSVGWTMVIFLWVLPLVGMVVTIDDYLPGGWGSERRGPGFFSSRENRFELPALVALPGLGFTLDVGAALRSGAFAAAGIIGVVACIQLVRIEQR